VKLYISLSASWWGGGSNTFAYNFRQWAKTQPISLVHRIEDADSALIIAASAEESELATARQKGCFLIHRVDEHFELHESAYRVQKHARIQALNRQCQVTVFQSEFVRENVLPHLQTKKHAVILNGGNADIFHPARTPGRWIGHVTWGVGEKKRLDLLDEAIQKYPQERFLLIGNHHKSPLNLTQHTNVRHIPRVPRFLMPYVYRYMKVLFFPSENDPCPNTAVESILSGVPVVFHPVGGTREVVRDCGLPLEQFDEVLTHLPEFQQRCHLRRDLDFHTIANQYMALFKAQ